MLLHYESTKTQTRECRVSLKNGVLFVFCQSVDSEAKQVQQVQINIQVATGAIVKCITVSFYNLLQFDLLNMIVICYVNK